MRFDQPYYIKINEARWAAAREILDQIPDLRTCLDVGCGPGWFTDRLVGRGLLVLGVEGRPELVEEARRRVPGALFSLVDVCDRGAMAALPQTDLVFCFGLLYHLDDPVAAIRAIVGLGRHVLIETQVAPVAGAMFQLVAEGRNETQGLDFQAVIPSRAALVHLLYKAGAETVARYTGRVAHEDFTDTPERVHRREIFLAGPQSRLLRGFVHEPLPPAPKLDTARPAGMA